MEPANSNTRDIFVSDSSNSVNLSTTSLNYLSNQISQTTDFKTSPDIKDFLNNQQFISSLHAKNFVHSPASSRSPNVAPPQISSGAVQSNTASLGSNRLLQLQPVINLAFQLGFVPIALNGKKPVLSSWPKIQKDSAVNALNDGFSRSGANNIGVICGKTSGIVVVDIDTKNEGLTTWCNLIYQHGDPYTFKVRTGSGGFHYYFKYDSDNEMLKSRSGAVKINGQKVGIDIKTNGGQVVFVGSLHPDTGRLYEWANNNPDGVQTMPPISTMPSWLLTLLLETESTSKTTNITPSSKSQLITTQASVSDVVLHQPSSSESQTFTLNLSNRSLTPLNTNNSSGDVNQKLDRNSLTELVNSLNVDRAGNYDDWIRVVWGIKSVSSDFFDIAELFSHRTQNNNYNADKLREVWNSGNGSITTGSLMRWLKDDIGEQQYQNFKTKYGLRRRCDSALFHKMISCQEHKFIAEYFIDKYSDDLKITHSTKGPYFLFNHQTLLWERLDLGPLGYRVSTLIQKNLEKYQGYIAGKIFECTDSEYKTKMQNLITVIRELIAKLAKLGFIKSVAECICCHHQDPTSLVLFDTKKGLIPIKGGLVIDIKNEVAIPRTRDDYFTYEFNIAYDPNKVDSRLDTFFATLMLEDRIPIENRIKTLFLQTLLGYGLTRENVEKYLIILWGEGNNGKSTLIYLLSGLFPYMIESASKHIIIEKQYNGGPNSELDRLRTCRLAIISETKESETLDEDIVKRITGGGKDKLNSRSLYINDSAWSPHFLPFIVTNNLPKCSGDQSLLKRILSFRFMTEFCDDPTLDYQRKKDKDFDKLWEDPDIQAATLTWIVKGGARYYREGLKIPKEVQETSEEFRKSRNSIELFLEECTEKCEISTYTGSTQLYNKYVQFCGSELFRESQTKFGAILVKRYRRDKHPSDRTVIYYGIKLREFNQNQLASRPSLLSL